MSMSVFRRLTEFPKMTALGRCNQARDDAVALRERTLGRKTHSDNYDARAVSRRTARGLRMSRYCVALAVVVIVGCNVGVALASVAGWEFAWNTLSPTGDTPAARCDSNGFVYNSKLHIFGGYEETHGVYNELSRYDVAASSWDTLNFGGDVPQERLSPYGAVVGSKYIVFGGADANSQYLNDLYYVDLAAATPLWVKVTPTNPADGPTGRTWGASAAYGTKLFVYGGYTGIDQNQAYFLETQTWTWELISYACPGYAGGEYAPPADRTVNSYASTEAVCSGAENINPDAPPLGTIAALMLSNAGAQLVVQDDGTATVNRTADFDTASGLTEWRSINGTLQDFVAKALAALNTGIDILQRANASSDAAVVAAAATEYDTLWMDLYNSVATRSNASAVDLSKLEICGDYYCDKLPCAVPPPVDGPSVVIQNDNAYIVGGWKCGYGNGRGGPDCFVGDVWVLNLVSRTWTKLNTTTATDANDNPQPIAYGSVSIYNNTIFLFGGGYKDAAQDWSYLNTLYTLDLDTLQWSAVAAKGELPLRRWSQIWKGVGSRMYLFGGCKPPNVFYNDIHVLFPVKTSAAKTVASGSALSVADAGVVSVFRVQARDINGADLNFGGDKVSMFSFQKAGFQYFQASSVRDNRNGTYDIFYKNNQAGEFLVTVTFNGADISGSPFSLVISPRDPNPATSSASGTALRTATAGAKASFFVSVIDVYGNKASAAGRLSVSLYGAGGSLASTAISISGSNGDYAVEYLAPAFGSYSIRVRINGTDISGSPFALSVAPAPASSSVSVGVIA
eukprot:Opistho-2@90829